MGEFAEFSDGAIVMMTWGDPSQMDTASLVAAAAAKSA
jgi:hypothetical protein